MKFLLKQIMKHKKLLFLNIFSVLLVIIAELGIPLITASIIDEVIIGLKKELFTKYIIMLAGASFVGILGHIFLNYCASKTSALILTDLREQVFTKVQTFSPKEMQEYGVPSILTRSSTDVFQILNFISTFYRSAILAPVMFILSVVLILVRVPKLAVSVVFVVPVVIIVLMIIVKKTTKLSANQQSQLDHINLITRENLTGVRVIRAFRKSKYEEERFEKTNKEYTETSIKLFRIMVSLEPMFYFFLNSSIIFLMYFGANLININEITLGNFAEFLDYQFYVMFSILTFSILFIMYPKTVVSAKRIEEIINTKVDISDNSNALSIEEDINEITFENVTFKYPDASLAVLENINFSVKKGEQIAFVGSTGSGKSTLIQLLPRLYDATYGIIKINGKDIKDYKIKDLRKKIGYIQQKAVLFRGTLEENLKFGNDFATKEEIDNGLRVALAYDFVYNEKDGLESFVAELGTNFSGGQKQRLSIAKAVIKNPDIYVFDDSFSALDYQTESTLRKNLKEVTKDKIVMIVAQRLSSIINADKIILLNEGKMIASGTHNELMKSSNIYKEIAKSQNITEVNL